MTRLVLAALTAFVLLVAPASATTYSENFDALADGTVVNTSGTAPHQAIYVGSPTVFTPTSTQSPPRALHTPSPCPTTTEIGHACGKQVITFQTAVNRVEMRVGLQDEASTFEFGTSARLKAYNQDNVLVGDSGDVQLDTQGAFVPITRLIAVQSAATDITRVDVFVGVPQDNEYSRRVNIDDLKWIDNATPVAPPSIRIDAPAAGQTFQRAGDVRVSGQVTAPAGVTDFCVSLEATIPASCPDRGRLDGLGRFSDLPITGLHAGANRVYVYARDTQTRVASASVDFNLSAFDLRPANMEVTQAVQSDLPAVTPAAFAGAHTAAYNGVPLAAGKGTFVRVWTDARFTSGPVTVNDVRMVLSATRNGESLGAPIAPVNGNRTLQPGDVTGSAVSDALRSSPTSAYVFQLPAAWTSGDVELTATINPTGYPGEISECEGCGDNNALRLTGIHFTPVNAETVTPVALVTRDASGRRNPLPNAQVAFFATSTVSPFPIRVRDYQATIDITSIANRSGCDADCMNGAAFDQVSNFDQDTPGWNRQGHIVGVNPGVARGLTAPVLFCCEPPRIDTLAVTDAGRPLTSVAHEFYHQLGFLHAGHDCPGDPGGFLGLFAEGWDPDHKGELRSFGFDPRANSGGAGMYAIEGTQDATGAATQFFDLMSYCTNNYPETNSWISARNWTRALQAHAASGRAAVRAATAGGRAAAGGRRTIAVTALQVGKADPVVSVDPGLRGTVKPPAGKRDAVIQLRDAAGDVVASAKTVTLHGHVDQGPDVVSVGATVPDPGNAVSASVRVGRKVLATITRPRVVPKLRVLAPRRGTKIGNRGTVLVRWKLLRGRAKSVAIDFAADGRRFRPIVMGIRGTRYRVPVSLLAHGRRARFRVRVSDGWNEGRAASARVAVAGPPLTTAIAGAGDTPRVAVDGTLQLEGIAIDDRGRPLRAGALAWYYGHRLLGRGRTVRINGLPAGRRSIRLVARDGRRTGTSAIGVDVVRRLP